MKQVVSKGLQEWLIAFAFMIVIPGTVYFGCNLISPKINYDAYRKQYRAFVKNVDIDRENPGKRDTAWKETSMYKEHQEKLCKGYGNRLLIAGSISVALFFVGSICALPIISSGLLGAANILVMMYSFLPFGCNHAYSIDTRWIQLLFITISLLIGLWYAYRYSKSANHK